MTPTESLLTTAAAHLHHAAVLAEQDWHPALAGQIRLAAASLPAAGEPEPPLDASILRPLAEGTDVAGLLALALDCLDQIPPLAGPADLQLSAWHLHELRRIAAAGVLS